MTALDSTITASLGPHLQATYGIDIIALHAWRDRVFRVERRDGPDWVTRVLPAKRPLDDAVGDATMLRALERSGFPAERLAHDEPVSEIGGSAVLVTRLVTGVPAAASRRTYASLGSLLGRLHSRTDTTARPGGAMHQLAPSGGPREEVQGAAVLLNDLCKELSQDEQRAAKVLSDDLLALPGADELPHAIVHPEFTTANAITTPDDRIVVVDWINSGRGPRLWSLAALLWDAGRRDSDLVTLVMSRYRKFVRFEDSELDALADVLRARPLVIAAVRGIDRPERLPGLAAELPQFRTTAEAAAERARKSMEEYFGGNRRPLSVLLSQSLAAWIDEVDELAGATAGPARLSWNRHVTCLAHIPAEGIEPADLRLRSRACLDLGRLTELGYLDVGSDGVVRLSASGHDAQRRFTDAADEIDLRWRQRVGSDLIDRLSDALWDVAAQFENEPVFDDSPEGRVDPVDLRGLPDCLPLLDVDLRTPGNRYVENQSSDVIATAPRPNELGALLSRVLLALTVEVERQSYLPLSVSANVLRVLTPAGVDVDDIPGLTGISPTGVERSLEILQAQGMARADRRGRARQMVRIVLTREGEHAQRYYYELSERVEKLGRDLFGAETLAALRRDLETVTAAWAGQVVPHFPMMLAPGGFPDGS